MVCANNKYTYPNVHMLSMSLLYHFHKANMFSNIIVLDSSTMFQTYDLILCDISCDCSHVPLHCPEKEKENKNKTENKRKRILN